MWEPKLNNIRRQQLGMVRFGGINYTENYAVGELADAKNLTTDHFPHLSQRKPRKKFKTYDGVSPKTMVVKSDKIFAAVELPEQASYDKAKRYSIDDVVNVENRDYRCIKEQKEAEEYKSGKAYFEGDLCWSGEGRYICLFEHTPSENDPTPETSPYWLSVSPGNEEYWQEEIAGRFIWDDEIVGTYNIRGEKQILSQLNRLIVFPDHLIFDADTGKFEGHSIDYSFPVGTFFVQNNILSLVSSSDCGYRYRGTYSSSVEDYKENDVVWCEEKLFVAGTDTPSGVLPEDMTDWAEVDEETIEKHKTIWVEKREPFERSIELPESTEIKCAKGTSLSEVYVERHTGSVVERPYSKIGSLWDHRNSPKQYGNNKIWIPQGNENDDVAFWREGEAYRLIKSIERNAELTGYIVRYISVSFESVTLDLMSMLNDGQRVKLDGFDKGTSYLYNFEKFNQKDVLIKSVSPFGIELETEGYGTSETPNAGEIRICSNVPAFDCVCMHENRVYGASGDTIYISALGSPLDFYNYNGLSTGSHSMRIDGEGEFTGCIGYGSFVAFFKEREVIKVYGNGPNNFQINSATMTGVEKGSAKSLCIVEGTLFYKAPTGIFAYTGGSHYTISSNFGIRSFKNAVAGTDGRRYYVSMTDEQNLPSLFVYDTLTKLWTREDDSKVLDFCVADGTMHMLAGQEVWQLRTESEERIEWSATLCPIVQETPLAKAYQRLMIRLETGADSLVNVELRTDNELTWKKVWGYSAKGKRVVDVPITVRRCDSLEVRISGVGECMIKGLFIDGKTGGRL